MPPLLTTTLRRLHRLATLDDTVYDELRFDSAATVPAVAVTAVGLLALGLGGWLWWMLSDFGNTGTVFIKAVLLGTIFGFVAWLAWLLVVYTVLRRLSAATMQVEQLLRTAGFASGVLVIGLLMVITPIAFGIAILALVAWAGTTQIAIERTIGRGGSDVLVANLAGFGVWLGIMSLLASGTNQVAPGPFLAKSIWDAIRTVSVTFS